MKSTQMDAKRTTFNVCFRDETLLANIKRIASLLRLNTSEFICKLLTKDLEKYKDVIEFIQLLDKEIELRKKNPRLFDRYSDHRRQWLARKKEQA